MYAFYFLSYEERLLYSLLLDGISSRDSSIMCSYIYSNAVINKIIKSVLIDNPHLFWFEGKWGSSKYGNQVCVEPLYTRTEFEIEAAKMEISSLAQTLSSIKTNEVDNAFCIYNWLINNVHYGNSSGGQTIFDALVLRNAVCKGLSKAYQFLLRELCIFSTLVEGTIDGRNKHIWNIVELNGRYYNVDVAAGYPAVYTLINNEIKKGSFFAISDLTIRKTHTFWDNNVPKLACTDDLTGGNHGHNQV